MVQKRAGEIGVLAAADGSGRCGATAKQVRTYSDTHGCEGGSADDLPETTTILNWCSVVAARARGPNLSYLHVPEPVCIAGGIGQLLG